MDRLQQDTIGYQLAVDFKKADEQALDLTDATVVLVFRRPSGMSFERPAQVVGAAKDGRAKYETRAGDLDEFGKWQYQGRASFTNGHVFPSAVKRFDVDANLTPPPIVIACTPVELGVVAPLQTLVVS